MAGKSPHSKLLTLTQLSYKIAESPPKYILNPWKANYMIIIPDILTLMRRGFSHEDLKFGMPLPNFMNIFASPMRLSEIENTGIYSINF
jgi:hypothetical protein